MKLFLALLFISANVFAQTITTLPITNSETTMSSFSWERIKARTKINYFNFATGPSIKKWDDNETSDFGTKNPEPTAMYHSFNVRFNLKGSLDYFMQPRFVTPMGDVGQLRPSQDHNAVMMDDWDYGFYYTFASQRTFNYGQALTIRAPFSWKSRGEQIQYMYVWQNLTNWAITPSLRFLNWTNLSYYDFNNQSTIERYRWLSRSLFSYTLSDKWMIQGGYELDMQHINPFDSSNPQHRGMNYIKRYHSYISAGFGYSPIPHWTVLPYIKSLDERNIRNETTVLGFMIFGKVI